MSCVVEKKISKEISAAMICCRVYVHGEKGLKITKKIKCKQQINAARPYLQLILLVLKKKSKCLFIIHFVHFVRSTYKKLHTKHKHSGGKSGFWTLFSMNAYSKADNFCTVTFFTKLLLQYYMKHMGFPELHLKTHTGKPNINILSLIRTVATVDKMY